MWNNNANSAVLAPLLFAPLRIACIVWVSSKTNSISSQHRKKCARTVNAQRLNNAHLQLQPENLKPEKRAMHFFLLAACTVDRGNNEASLSMFVFICMCLVITTFSVNLLQLYNVSAICLFLRVSYTINSSIMLNNSHLNLNWCSRLIVVDKLHYIIGLFVRLVNNKVHSTGNYRAFDV